MDSSECSICFEAIGAETGHVKMGCSHLFHFRCIAHWFTQQAANDLPQNCPCCRRVGSESETFPPLPADAEEEEEEEDDDDSAVGGGDRLLGPAEEDESYEEDDEGEELCLTRAELHALLVSQGGTGVSDSFWRFFFEEDDEEGFQDPALVLPFVRRELNQYLIAQGGRILEDYEWERALDTGGDAPEEAPLVIQVFRGWRRVNAGRWERVEVLNPEEDVWDPSSGAGREHPNGLAIWDGLLDGAAEPPDSLVLQMCEAATKMKALWKGAQTRERFSAARALLML